jgi:MFS family permease
LQDIVPPGLRATAVALVLFVGNLLGNAFAPTLVGALARALAPTHGQHFAQQVAGLDLSLALAYTCPPVLVIAGLIGILGARLMKGDMLAAQRMSAKDAPLP